MQAQVTKGELIAELKGKTASRAIRDVSSRGVTMEDNSEGQMTGKLNASHLETTMVHIKTDGSMEWDSKAVETTADGDLIASTGKGKAQPSTPGNATFDGEMTFMTASKNLAWLNNTKNWIEGTVNMQSGEYQAKIYQRK